MENIKGFISPAQSSSQIHPLPQIPHNEKETSLYKVVKNNNNHPPVMQKSWTFLSPYKEKRHHRFASERIANTITPQVADITLKDLYKKKPKAKSFGIKPKYVEPTLSKQRLNEINA